MSRNQCLEAVGRRSDDEPGVLEHARQYVSDIAVVIHHEHRVLAGRGAIVSDMREQSTRSEMLQVGADTEPPGSGGGRRTSLQLCGEEVSDLIHVEVRCA